MKRAIITGITGQDGAYLARFLLRRGYEVWGTTRDSEIAGTGNLERLGIRAAVRLESMSLTDFRSILQVVTRIKPDEIYHLAGQSSVGLSFQQPVETLDSIANGTLNLLEVLRYLGGGIRMLNAGSGEMFGDTGETRADEQTPFRPSSPYAVAKVTSCHLVATYRQAYGLHASNAVLFNHESPLRNPRFVTAKIAVNAIRIADEVARGLAPAPLVLGNLDIERDWGWAPEYVEAAWRILQLEAGDDFVLATGRPCQLRDFVAGCFAAVGIDGAAHVVSDRALFRPTDHRWGRGNPAKAASILGWSAQRAGTEVAKQLVECLLRKSTD
jgi:GDPmannose 4,6-dehydratase